MSSFKCPTCATPIIDNPDGSTTACEHFPWEHKKRTSPCCHAAITEMGFCSECHENVTGSSKDSDAIMEQAVKAYAIATVALCALAYIAGTVGVGK